MKYVFFAGCKIENGLKHYETASRAVLEKLGVELVDLELNCCGYPIRHQNIVASVLSAARNLALASRRRLDILTPCKCCFGNLKYAVSRLREDEGLRRKINLLLEKEGLVWRDDVQVRHLLSVLYHEVGIERIREKTVHRFRELKIAAHYGCHALRPGNVTRFDDPLAPTLFEKLVEATGAEAVSWSRRLECCGSPLWERNNPLALHMMQRKLEDADASGADFLCVACTYCQIQFDQVRINAQAQAMFPWRETLPSILYPQLLGLCLGVNGETLGIGNNLVDMSVLSRYCQ